MAPRWGGKEGTRSEVTPTSSKPLGQPWLWLVTDLGQQSRHGLLASPVLLGSLIHSPGPRNVTALRPCLSILLFKFSSSTSSSCFCGDCALRHQTASPGSFLTASPRFHVIPSTAIKCQESQAQPNWYPPLAAMPSQHNLHVPSLSWGQL